MPLLFSGSIRDNLDPTDVVAARGGTDADLWRILCEIGLGEVVRGMGGLDAQLVKGGASLSQGQRQLFSLVRCAFFEGGWEVLAFLRAVARFRSAVTVLSLTAAPEPHPPNCQTAPANGTNPRALLRGAQVLAMDEGTANLDAATDSTIQRTLNRLLHHRSVRRPSSSGGSSAGASSAGNSSHSSSRVSRTSYGPGVGSSNVFQSLVPPRATLIIVAHRLDTVAHTDTLLVMSQGRVVEQGPPARLATRPGGTYAAMLGAMNAAKAVVAAGAGGRQ